MAGVGTFISVGKSLDQAVERVQRAEELGYDSAYVTHIAGRDSLTVLMAYAAATERIKLGTGVLPIYSRTPVATAQQAATIDEFSGGPHGARARRLAPGHRRELVRQPRSSSRCTAMREYVGDRARDASRRGRRPRASSSARRFRFMGYEPRAGPADLRRRPVAEDAAARGRDRRRRDAVALQPRLHPRRRRARGAGGPRAGRQELDGFDIVAAVPAAVTDDRAAAYETMRADLITYWSLPVLPRDDRALGLRRRHRRFDAGMQAGRPRARPRRRSRTASSRR